MSVAFEKNVAGFVGPRRQLFIDGEWVDAESGAVFDTNTAGSS